MVTLYSTDVRNHRVSLVTYPLTSTSYTCGLFGAAPILPQLSELAMGIKQESTDPSHNVKLVF